MLPERGLHLQLLLDGRVRQLRAVALHLGSRAEGALQPARRVLHVLQLALQALKLGLPLGRYKPGLGLCTNLIQQGFYNTLPPHNLLRFSQEGQRGRRCPPIGAASRGSAGGFRAFYHKP